MEIRPETPDDAAAVDAVVTAAFASPRHGRLVADLREDPSYRADRALVAVEDGAVIGFVMVTDSTVGRGARLPTLSPLAVAPDHQRQGIGSALVSAVLDRCRDDGEVALALEGDPRYYGGLGFVPAERFGLALPLPPGVPSTAAQVAVLGDPEAVPRGPVRYAGPFTWADEG